MKRPIQQILADAATVNHLYRGDCLSVLDRIEDESVDLIYIDPPFFSQRYYETIWDEDAERHAFEDRWKGGILTYLNYLVARLQKLYQKLSQTGSIYVHLDWHIGHYVKVELDKLFGYGNFQNEVIWYYRGGGVSKQRFGRRHDTLFFYAKGNTWTFNADAVRTEYSQESLERLQYKAKAFRGDKVYDNYEPNPLGKHPDDVWIMQPIMPSAKERLGYPTQKPLRLLENVIKASSNPGDLVLDSFCGCGTTMEAAQLLGRRWIGIDISQSALRVVQNRLRKIGLPHIELHGMVESEKELHELSWQDFQNWAVDAIQGHHSPRKVAEMGIDGFTFMEHHPIQVKQMSSVGRPVVDNFVGVLERQKDKRGVIIAFDFTKGAVAEVARLLREDKIEIELITCKQLVEEEIPFRKMV